MGSSVYVKVNEADNVAIALHDIRTGADIGAGVTAQHDIPQAHKVTLTNIPRTGPTSST